MSAQEALTYGLIDKVIERPMLQMPAELVAAR
jgi:ATP-dependent protease ClpP protease subunit